MKKFLLSSLLLSCSLSAFAADRALIIGIGDQYSGGITPLPNPKNDLLNSQQIARGLGFKPNEIKVLQGNETTRKNILSAIDNWLIKDTQPGDNVYFYYSGHGTQVPDRNGDEKDGRDEALLPSDAHLHQSRGLVNAITDDELDHRFRLLSNRNVISIFDSCNSGTVTRGLGNRTPVVPIKTIPTGNFARPSQQFLNTLKPETVINSAEFQESRNEVPFVASKKQRTVWSAASSSQLAFVDQSNPQRVSSKFTQLIFDGFLRKQADRNKNGIITNSEMYNYVAQQSAQYCNSIQRRFNACPLGLTPVLSIDPEQRNLKFGFPNTVQPQIQASTQAIPTTLSDTLPEQSPQNIYLAIQTVKGNNTQLTFNEKITVVAKANKSGYLYLLDHDSDNEVRFLFPHGVEDNYVNANTPTTIPDRLKHNFALQAFKKGKAELVAVLTQDTVDTKTLTNAVRDFKTLSAKQLGEFSSKIAAIHVGDRTNRLNNYSIKRLPYNVR